MKRNNMPPTEDYTAPLLIYSCVYVLLLEGDRYYVGVTQNLSMRLAQHYQSRGSQATRAYPPIDVEKVIFGGGQKCERETTLKYIRKFGFNFPDGSPRVRGGGWAGINSKGPKEKVVDVTPETLR